MYICTRWLLGTGDGVKSPNHIPTDESLIDAATDRASSWRRQRQHQWLRVEGVSDRTDGFTLKASAAASMNSRWRSQQQNTCGFALKTPGATSIIQGCALIMKHWLLFLNLFRREFEGFSKNFNTIDLNFNSPVLGLARECISIDSIIAWLCSETHFSRNSAAAARLESIPRHPNRRQTLNDFQISAAAARWNQLPRKSPSQLQPACLQRQWRAIPFSHNLHVHLYTVTTWHWCRGQKSKSHSYSWFTDCCSNGPAFKLTPPAASDTDGCAWQASPAAPAASRWRRRRPHRWIRVSGRTDAFALEEPAATLMAAIFQGASGHTDGAASDTDSRATDDCTLSQWKAAVNNE